MPTSEHLVPDRDRNAEGRPENARPRDRFGRPLPRGAVDEMPERVDPADLVTSVEDALRRGAALYDAERFFEAHEFFEWAWKADDVTDADRPFWKGVAQAAVGCCHVQRGNAEGALTLLRRAAEAVEQYPSPHLGIANDRLAAATRDVADQVERHGPSPDLDFPRFPLVA